MKALSDIESTAWSETAASNNTASPNGFPEGMAPSGVNDSTREMMRALKSDWNRSHCTISSTGSANAYVLTPATAIAGYVNGQRFSFKASFANTASATVNVSGIGAKTINQHSGAGLAALSGSEIQANHHVTVEYDSGADVFVLISPTPASSGSLGTIASQNANNVNITGGTASGVTLSSLASDLSVSDGGTGRSTLTNHGVLVGAGTSAISQTATGTSGQVLTSNGSGADPTFQDPASASSVVPTGTLLPYAGTTNPTGYLLCDGSAVSRTTYSVLFGIISTTYGSGNGSTTFNLPDLRGRTAVGKDNMGGSTAGRITNANSGITGTTLGAAGGLETLMAHSHTIAGTTNASGSGNPSFASNASGTTVNTGTTGTGTTQGNVQPSIILNYIIKT